MYLPNKIFSKVYFHCIWPFYFPQEPIFIHEITTPNMISTFWQLPQIMIITAGEILFSITSLKFAFSQVSQFFSKLLHHIRSNISKIPCSLIMLSKDFDIVKMSYFFVAGTWVYEGCDNGNLIDDKCHWKHNYLVDNGSFQRRLWT